MELRICYLHLYMLSWLAPVVIMDLHCPYPACRCQNHAINCIGSSLNKLPELSNETFHGTWTLELRYQSITHVPKGSLPSSLTKIDFRYNPVPHISPDAFDDSGNTLETLYFSEAKFYRFPTALIKLTNLKTLWIYDARITDWNLDVLKHIGKTLEELILRRVGLKVWPDWINQFHVLKNLELVGVPMSDMPDDALNSLKMDLENLTLTQANFTHIPKALAVLQQLKMLDMSKNQINNTDGLPKLPKIEGLDLGYNQISSVSNFANGLHPYEASLKKLNIEHNNLTVIPLLNKMLNLNLVILGYNQISDPASGSFPPVATSLRLGPNRFPSIPDAVSKVSTVIELWLSDNLITGTGLHYTNIPLQLELLSLYRNKIIKINDDSFPQKSSLKSIYLDHNPISTISPLAFQNLVHLRVLTLTYTNLTRMPVALAWLPNLCFLHLFANSQLVCTCAESQITDWFESRSFNNMSVTGRCGQDTFISNFFRELACKCPTPAPIAGLEIIKDGIACER